MPDGDDAATTPPLMPNITPQQAVNAINTLQAQLGDLRIQLAASEKKAEQDEFKSVWKSVPRPILKDGQDWSEWNFKWQTVCARAHNTIYELIKLAEVERTEHHGHYDDPASVCAIFSMY